MSRAVPASIRRSRRTSSLSPLAHPQQRTHNDRASSTGIGTPLTLATGSDRRGGGHPRSPNCGAGNNDSTHHLLGFTYLGGKWSNQHRWQRNPRPHGCCTRQLDVIADDLSVAVPSDLTPQQIQSNLEAERPPGSSVVNITYTDANQAQATATSNPRPTPRVSQNRLNQLGQAEQVC